MSYLKKYLFESSSLNIRLIPFNMEHFKTIDNYEHMHLDEYIKMYEHVNYPYPKGIGASQEA